MDITAVALFWGPLLVLVVLLLLLGIRRDRGRPTQGRGHRTLRGVALLCGLLVTATTGFAGWAAYPAERSESCAQPTPDC